MERLFILSGKFIHSIPYFYFVFNVLYPNTNSQSWSSIKIKKGIGKLFEITLKEELRLKNNFNNFDEISSDIDVAYKISDKIKISFPYKFILKDGSSKHSFSFSSKLKYKKGPFNFNYRYKFESIQSSEELSKNRIRNLIYMEFSIYKKSKMFISHEYLLPYKSKLELVNEQRSSIAILFKIANSSSAKVAYTLRTKNFIYPKYLRNNILNTDLIYSF